MGCKLFTPICIYLLCLFDVPLCIFKIAYIGNLPEGRLGEKSKLKIDTHICLNARFTMISNSNCLKVYVIVFSCKTLIYNKMHVVILANLLVIIGKVKSAF